MTRTPWGYEKPERRAERAESHHCDATGATEYVLRENCPYCNEGEQ